MKRIRKHKNGCSASAAARTGKRETVWMTPELVEGKLLFVCADAGCDAKLEILDLDSIKLPKL